MNLYPFYLFPGTFYEKFEAARAQAATDGYLGSSALVMLVWGADFEGDRGGRCLALEVRR